MPPLPHLCMVDLLPMSLYCMSVHCWVKIVRLWSSWEVQQLDKIWNWKCYWMVCYRGKSNKLCILIWLWVKSSCLACLQIMLLVYYLFFFHTVLRVFLIMESVLGSQFWMGWMHRFLCRSDTEFKYTLLSAYYCFFKHLNKG